MSAPKPYETRPDDLLIESPELPGLFWNMRTGLVCNKDGKLLTISPTAGLTNDPQAGYVAEQRPLLSYRDMIALLDEEAEDNGVNDETPDGKLQWSGMTMGGVVLREFYEAKITSGELMVSKTATLIPGKYGGVECSQCGRDYPNPGVDPNSLNVGEFCRCGARIIE